MLPIGGVTAKHAQSLGFNPQNQAEEAGINEYVLETAVSSNRK